MLCAAAPPWSSRFSCMQMIDVAAHTHGAQLSIWSSVGEMHRTSAQNTIFWCRCTYTTVIHMPDGDGGERVNINRGGLVGARSAEMWLISGSQRVFVLCQYWLDADVCGVRREQAEASILVCSQSFSLCGNKRAFYNAIFLVSLNMLFVFNSKERIMRFQCATNNLLFGVGAA
jgi:hypothetical protein